MKCKVCRKEIKQKAGPGRPRKIHARCKGGVVHRTSKKRGKKVRRSTTTRGKGRCLVGAGSGWLVFHYAGQTDAGNVSNKTWAIKVSGSTVTTRHGKSWGQKKETPKHLSSRAAAVAFANRKIKEKTRKGYYCIGAKRKTRRHRGR